MYVYQSFFYAYVCSFSVFFFRWRCAWIWDLTGVTIWFYAKMYVSDTEASSYKRKNSVLQRSRFNNFASACSNRLVVKGESSHKYMVHKLAASVRWSNRGLNFIFLFGCQVWGSHQSIKIVVFWAVISCNMVNEYHFRGISWLLLQGSCKLEAACSCETLTVY